MATTTPDNYDVVDKDTFLSQRESEKLPVWAQDRLIQARRDEARAVSALKDLQDSQEKTSVSYGDVYDNPRYLPDEMFARVRFEFDAPEGPKQIRLPWLDVRRMVDQHTGLTFVELSSSDGIAVVPQASNVLRVHNIQRGQL